MTEIEELKDLYDVARRSVVRAKSTKLNASRMAEVRQRERLMAIISVDIRRLKTEALHKKKSAGPAARQN